MVDLCCTRNIPHNIFFTFGVNEDLRCFFFPRLSDFVSDKVFTSHLNIAFCELSGYIPVGDEEMYDKMDENYVLGRIKEELGSVCSDIEGDVLCLYR